MKTWTMDRFGSDDFAGLARAERPDPVPGPRDVVVRMQAVSLNYRDLMVARGTYGLATQPGLVPASDGAGHVVAVGGQVTRFKVGDRVAPIFNQHWIAGEFTTVCPGGELGGSTDGVLAEQVLLPEDGLVLLPDSLSFEEAATLPCAGVTAWTALAAGRQSRAGDTLLVQGSGGVSVFALQLGKTLGMRVIATTSSATKAERLRALGADEVVDYKVNPEWAKPVRELTGGVGVDRIVEVGGPGTFPQSMDALRPGGIISVVGLLSGTDGRIDPLRILQGPMSVHGIRVGSRADFEVLLAAITTNGIKPVIDRTFGFEEVRDAYRHLAAQRHFGKVVVRVD